MGAGVGGGLLMRLLRAVQHFVWSYRAGEFVYGVEGASPGRRVIVLIAAGILAGLARKILRYATGGHGGEVSEAIWFRSGRFPAIRTLSRAVLSIVLVGLGASVGREGAPKQAGAVIASKLADWERLSASQRRVLAACGAGAGMAAVYNVPLGGALFALEVLLGTLALPLVLPALATSMVATAVSWTIMAPRTTYLIPSYHISQSQIVWAAIAGPLAGIAASLYVRLIGWADRRKPSGWRTIASPIVVFALLGVAAIAYPQLLGNGKDVVQATYVNQLPFAILGVLFVLKPLATAGCLGSGAPGGLFTPTLTYGALFGALLGQGWRLIWPGAQPATYAIIGSGAVLAATTEGPVSSVVLLLELTHRIDVLMVPLMLAVAGATLTGRLLDTRSIYSARIRLGEEAAVAEAPSKPVGRMKASCGNDLVSSSARYSLVVQRMLAQGDNSSLRVVDDEGKVIGEIHMGDVAHPDASIAPIETATAGDLIRTPA
ncbi:MAG TPA: chloride channel protein [Candidatus Binataceae bacterium]|nr:chloride channel protein [Candidatus Binataceae bacterium]